MRAAAGAAGPESACSGCGRRLRQVKRWLVMAEVLGWLLALAVVVLATMVLWQRAASM